MKDMIAKWCASLARAMAFAPPAVAATETAFLKFGGLAASRSWTVGAPLTANKKQTQK
jgi:hypothetical protein